MEGLPIACHQFEVGDRAEEEGLLREKTIGEIEQLAGRK